MSLLDLLFGGGGQQRDGRTDGQTDNMQYEKAQLDHTTKQYTRGQLSTFNTVSMICRTEQPRTHACTH